MLHLTLYKYTNKPIIVDKSSYLGTGLAVTGDAMTSNQDMENPVVLLSFTTEPDYNYAYIQEYHRYYYLTNKTWVSANVWMHTFHVDELYTYKSLVKSLSGIVAYSSEGSTYKVDPRLVYNEPLVRTTFNPNEPTHAFSYLTPGNEWIMLRYYYMDINISALPGYPWHINCVYMTRRSYNYFLSELMALYLDPDKEDLAVAICSTIIDVSVVYYIDPETTDKNAFINSTSDLNIVFNAPAVLKANSGTSKTLAAGVSTGTGWGAYQVNPTQQGLSGRTFTFTRGSVYGWTRMSELAIYLPYLGKLTLNPAKMGLDDDLTYTIGVKVVHECSENAYIVTALLNGVELRETREVWNVTTTVPFPVDVSFENGMGVMQNNILGVLSGWVGMISRAGMTWGASLMTDAPSYVEDVSSRWLAEKNLMMRDALSKQFIGTIGGSPDLIDVHNAGDTIFAVATIQNPAANYAYFWADHGMPDGAYRSLNTMTGYVQMKEFEIVYDSNATIGEMQRLEAQLYRGVIL